VGGELRQRGTGPSQPAAAAAEVLTIDGCGAGAGDALLAAAVLARLAAGLGLFRSDAAASFLKLRSPETEILAKSPCRK
jgi:hypothetical protein